jgi:hypothetical protein
VAADAGDLDSSADCSLVHSMKSFLSNTPMSCSKESSRAASGVMAVVVDLGISGSR